MSASQWQGKICTSTLARGVARKLREHIFELCGLPASTPQGMACIAWQRRQTARGAVLQATGGWSVSSQERSEQ